MNIQQPHVFALLNTKQKKIPKPKLTNQTKIPKPKMLQYKNSTDKQTLTELLRGGTEKPNNNPYDNMSVKEYFCYQAAHQVSCRNKYFASQAKMFSEFNHADRSCSLVVPPNFLFPEMCLAVPSGLYHTYRKVGHASML